MNRPRISITDFALDRGRTGLVLLASVAVWLETARGATSIPLEFRQPLTPYNLQSVRGVPISGVAQNPPGSDGRQPAGSDNQSGSSLPATPNQFGGFIGFGAIP